MPDAVPAQSVIHCEFCAWGIASSGIGAAATCQQAYLLHLHLRHSAGTVPASATDTVGAQPTVKR
jgi:hypothetical protein